MKWLKQSDIAPPVDTPVLIKGPDGTACEAAFRSGLGQAGMWWSWTDVDDEIVYSSYTLLRGTLDTIEWAPLPGQLLPMHCLRPEMRKVLVFCRYPDGYSSSTMLWWSVDCSSWEDREGVFLERTDGELGFLIIPTDAAELTVLDIPEGDTK